jgi:hypothetical protein
MMITAGTITMAEVRSDAVPKIKPKHIQQPRANISPAKNRPVAALKKPATNARSTAKPADGKAKPGTVAITSA